MSVRNALTVDVEDYFMLRRWHPTYIVIVGFA